MLPLFQIHLYLHVDISTIVNEQLETQHPAGGGGGQVQRCVAVVIWLVDVSTIVHQLIGHSVLSHVARHVEGRVSKGVGLISLRDSKREV